MKGIKKKKDNEEIILNDGEREARNSFVKKLKIYICLYMYVCIYIYRYIYVHIRGKASTMIDARS